MAPRRRPFQSKLRTREHVLGDLAVNHVERQGLLCSNSFERFYHDYGFDLLMFTYNEGEMEDGAIFLQVRGTEVTGRSRDQQTIPFRVSRADVITWLRPLVPVILVVYDASVDSAFWIHVQAYFNDLPEFNLFRLGQTTTLHLPIGQTLTPESMRHFAEIRTRTLERGRDA